MIEKEMTDTYRTAASIGGSGGALDGETRTLVRLAGIISAGSESQVRDALAQAAADCRQSWVEEVLLQSYLFAGFPRALNSTREWRRISGLAAPDAEEGDSYEHAGQWRVQGEMTCATVYGPFYERIRENIRDLQRGERSQLTRFQHHCIAGH